MRSYSDDIPNAEELKRNTKLTLATNDLLKDNLVRIIEQKEDTDAKLKILSRENTRNTILLIVAVAAAGASLALQIVGLNMG